MIESLRTTQIAFFRFATPSGFLGGAVVDCLQSAISLKIRLALDSSNVIANHDVINTKVHPRFSRLAALPLACSNFAKKNKRLLAVYPPGDRFSVQATENRIYNWAALKGAAQ